MLIWRISIDMNNFLDFICSRMNVFIYDFILLIVIIVMGFMWYVIMVVWVGVDVVIEGKVMTYELVVD